MKPYHSLKLHNRTHTHTHKCEVMFLSNTINTVELNDRSQGSTFKYIDMYQNHA